MWGTGDTIDDLDIGVRAANLLYYAGYRKVTEVEALAHSDLLKLEGCGPVTIADIRRGVRAWRKRRDLAKGPPLKLRQRWETPSESLAEMRRGERLLVVVFENEFKARCLRYFMTGDEWVVSVDLETEDHREAIYWLAKEGSG